MNPLPHSRWRIRSHAKEPRQEHNCANDRSREQPSGVEACKGRHQERPVNGGRRAPPPHLQRPMGRNKKRSPLSTSRGCFTACPPGRRSRPTPHLARQSRWPLSRQSTRGYGPGAGTYTSSATEPRNSTEYASGSALRQAP